MVNAQRLMHPMANHAKGMARLPMQKLISVAKPAKKKANVLITELEKVTATNFYSFSEFFQIRALDINGPDFYFPNVMNEKTFNTWWHQFYWKSSSGTVALRGYL